MTLKNFEKLQPRMSVFVFVHFFQFSAYLSNVYERFFIAN